MIASMTRAFTASVSLAVPPLPGSSREPCSCGSKLRPIDEEGAREEEKEIREGQVNDAFPRP